MLERMADFFNSRVRNYEEHQLNCIDQARQFYFFTAEQFFNGANILDLGCGTGLEFDYFFKMGKHAKITGIDISIGMLDAFKAKFKDKAIKLVHGSFFDVEFGENIFDVAVEVEAMHHFKKLEKIFLYSKVKKALKQNGYFILTDYFAASDDEEKFNFKELSRLKKKQKIICRNEFYHFDTPLTVDHEIEVLKLAGFSKVKILKSFGATYILKAGK